MEFTNEFIVPTPPDEAWKLLTDVPRVAPCLPGAAVTPQDDGTYAGTVTVKVGPIKVSYSGTAAFTERDATARRMVLDAGGQERSGKGSAKALVTVVLTGEGPDKTRVVVDTDLQITGKVAQFGRSAMADVGARVIGQFAANLETMIGASSDGGATVSADAGNGLAGAPRTASADSELNAVALVAPMVRRSAPVAGAFAAGALIIWLFSRRR
ncbi:SRPBCC family protein [Streptomyces sp. DSM 41524]|uniref:SRPBCC family protein n=1 Tax=Streptomyces asiaticus subsp. ignotus TaxID=3098222 RepID=A0ABU7QE36_9ACTN|nr:SRPBCC family protein [Streptomyces sp. DSM 41524]